ncbi:NAD-dependent epimerase/dehydratase family protein [Nonomuraea endophytica]|uniref:Nucleoside-diphosphate-sugar epimerase n=1 Tax=Nonomuraea endophytica TaxID=714136 RepID=A0A7W8A3B5_9ACTN|nr:NAD(P)-dependent oxidoreductase [Nonomuraea endophytica]MBB5078817.1 nucleoside-diphosphate-sugar epimerase [Nonomuraea endophytica]
MRVLVTGAAGHIGRYVLRELAEHDYLITATDVAPFEAPEAHRVHVGDLRDPELVRSAMAGADGVVHLGAIPHPVSDDPSQLFATNCLTAHRVLDEAGRTGVRRVVAASSLAAVGLAWAPQPGLPRYLPLDEEHPILVEDPYGLSKLVLEEIAHATHRRWGTDVVSLRMPFTGTDTRLKDQLAAVAANPEAHRNDLWAWLDTRDAATAVRHALTAGLRGSHVVNVAAPDTSAPLPTTVLLDRYLPQVPLSAEFTGHTSLVDSSTCAKLLGFRPGRSWRG